MNDLQQHDPSSQSQSSEIQRPTNSNASSNSQKLPSEASGSQLEPNQKASQLVFGNYNFSDLVIQKEYDTEEGIKMPFSKITSLSGNDKLLCLAQQIVGRRVLINTPYGLKIKVYMDFTASGQEIFEVQKRISKMMEKYANIHTETSHTGAATISMMNQAEETILRVCKADRKHYFMTLGGGGSTYAIEMAQKILGCYLPPKTTEVLGNLTGSECLTTLKEDLRKKNKLPLVLVTHYEHHSNEVPWRNQLCDVMQVSPDDNGRIDFVHIEDILKTNTHRPVIGTFSAGSNVTGFKTPVYKIAELLKKYGRPSFFDYGAVGPYVEIDLSKMYENRPLIDGIYISPHKFLGGPGSVGVLIINKELYHSHLAPTHGGGGTVDYVCKKGQAFCKKIEDREKSGTPCIAQIIKCGLAFDLKSLIQKEIDAREEELNIRFFERIKKIDNLVIYGPHCPHSRVGIISFNIKHKDRYLQSAFVIRLFNDLFGIQGRPGWSCSGPFSHYLLGIDETTSEEIKFWILDHVDLGDEHKFSWVKPGWARINLHYTMTDSEFEYFMKALEFISEHGYKFLTVYELQRCGKWTHKFNPVSVSASFGLGKDMDMDYYAKDEESRNKLFAIHINQAHEELERLPQSQGLDEFPEMGGVCRFYAEKGNVKDRDIITMKFKFFEKYFKEIGMTQLCRQCSWDG